MDADAITAAVGLVGALVGAAAGYLGAVRAAARANRPAWTSTAIDAARLLLASQDPASRAEGSRLLEAAAAAIGGAGDAPEQLRRATRGRHLAGALEHVRAVTATGAVPRIAHADPPRQAAVGGGAVGGGAVGGGAVGGTTIVVSAQDVEAAAAEVRAFRAAGLVPDPDVVAVAGVEAG